MYRKFKGDNIFTGHKIIDSSFVLITSAEGEIEDIVKEENAGEGIEQLDGLICPGFINAHCHVELSNLKDSIPAGTGLVQFVQQVMAKRFLVDEHKSIAMQKAVEEMEACGIVAVGDICNTSDALPIKKQSKIHWHNFIELSGFVDSAASQRLQAAKEIAAVYSETFKQTTLSPHAPYSVSAELFKQLNIETANQLISIHNQECEAENDLYINKTGGFLDLYKNFKINISSFNPSGKSSLQTWLPYFNKQQSIIAVHNTMIGLDDLNFLKNRNIADGNIMQSPIYFCLCVNANKYIEQKLPPIDLLRASKVNLVLGTDSYASNWQLNILEEIKTIQQATLFTVPLEEILQWATINGARVLRMENDLGSFDKGKKPGVVLITDLDRMNTTATSKAIRIL